MAQARQTRVVQAAKANIGSKSWAKFGWRNSPLGNFIALEWKCNLFVAEMLHAGGFTVPTVNKAGKWVSVVLTQLDLSTQRPPCAIEWFDGKVPSTTLVGAGSDGLDKSWPGDIVCTKSHVGIISGPQKTISANGSEVVENDWAWRPKEWSTVKVYRYHP
jgi:hypothetical protein